MYYSNFSSTTPIVTVFGANLATKNNLKLDCMAFSTDLQYITSELSKNMVTSSSIYQ
ncbi:25095_t:CDS:2, partial [Gigaspora margarita]